MDRCDGALLVHLIKFGNFFSILEGLWGCGRSVVEMFLHIFSFSLEKRLTFICVFLQCDRGFTFVFKTKSRIAFNVASKQKQHKKKIPCFDTISIFQRPKSDEFVFLDFVTEFHFPSS